MDVNDVLSGVVILSSPEIFVVIIRVVVDVASLAELSVQLILMMTFLFILLAFLRSHVFWPRAKRGALSCLVVSSATSTLAVWVVARGKATVRALARHCLMLAEHWQQSEHWQDTGRVLAMLEPKWIRNIYIYILGSHMAPYGACEVAQSTARSKAQFEAERFRRGFRRRNKHE